MNGLLAIYRRELAGLFFQPLAWILLALGLLWNGLFLPQYLSATQGDVNQALVFTLGGSWTSMLLLLALPPLLTMRMISEEARSGLLEFALTAPVRDRELVCGKALAAASFMALLWCSAPLYGLVLALEGAPVDWGRLACAYLGIALASMLYCALGLVASAVCAAPALAAFLAFAGGAAWLMLPYLLQPVRLVEARTLDAWIAPVNVGRHLTESFQRGALDSAHLVFFLAWIAALLFLCTRLVEARRWR